MWDYNMGFWFCQPGNLQAMRKEKDIQMYKMGRKTVQ